MPLPLPSALPRSRQALGLLVWLALCTATSAVGALASSQSRAFYAQLVQPA